MRILVSSIVDLKRTSHNRLHQLLRHLSDNHEMTVISINDCWKSEETDVSLYNVGFEKMLRDIDIRYITGLRVSPIVQESSSFLPIFKSIKDINRDGFDIHFNYNTLVLGLRVARKMESEGVNTVYDVADDLPEMIRTSPQVPILLRGFGGLVGDFFVRKNIEMAKKVTFITESLRDSYDTARSKTEMVPNGVDVDLFRPLNSTRLREDLGMEDDFVVGYVGVLREWIDLEPLLIAVKRLNGKLGGIKVLVVGEEGGLQKNKALVKKYELSDKVVFTGTVPWTRVPEYISCMDVCTIPFKANSVSMNSLPLKLFEYMACEKPVISTRVDGVEKAVGDRILYASTSDEYFAVLSRLYRNGSPTLDLGRENRRFVKRNYNWASIAHRFEEILFEAT